MLTTAQLLSRAKATQGNCSNYRLARLLDVPEKTMQRWSTGKYLPGEKNTAKLAELAGIDPAEAVAAINAERAAEPSMRALWESIAKRLHATAAALLAVVLSLWISGGPDGAAMAATPGSSAAAAPVGLHGNGSTHWRALVLRALAAVRRGLGRIVDAARLPAADIPAPCFD